MDRVSLLLRAETAGRLAAEEAVRSLRPGGDLGVLVLVGEDLMEAGMAAARHLDALGAAPEVRTLAPGRSAGIMERTYGAAIVALGERELAAGEPSVPSAAKIVRLAPRLPERFDPPTRLPAMPLYRVDPMSRDEVRRVDSTAINEGGIPGMLLMENAGSGAAQAAYLMLGGPGKAAVLAGRGNNGGDGFVLARYLAGWGCEVEVFLCAEKASLAGDAALNARLLEEEGVEIAEVAGGDMARVERTLAQSSIAVDALLGTGAAGRPRGLAAEAIDILNSAGLPILALDVPSGLDCDTGRAEGAAVVAAKTATFAAPKIGFDLADGPRCTGEVILVQIGAPRGRPLLPGGGPFCKRGLPLDPHP